MNNAKITKISFRFGIIDSMKEKTSCEEHVLTDSGIPSEVQKIFDSDKIAELSGKWGDSRQCAPIQYHWAKVELENGKSYEFEVCNLAIMIFHSKDEKIKRLFRFLVKVESCVKNHE